MPDSYAHKFNGQNAMRIAQYTPRSYPAFILGCNGPDPLFSYKMYLPFHKKGLNTLGTKMHNEKTGLFLQNLFRLAKTNTQKDYCLGFLCHYSLDSTLHPYVNYITSAYASPYNIRHGHGYFESALDSYISHTETGSWAAQPEEYFPEIKKMQLDQIITLFKRAVQATYDDSVYPREDYLRAFKDFKLTKRWMYSTGSWKIPIGALVEKLLGLGSGFVTCHMQPCKRVIKNVPMWRNVPVGFFCTATIQELFGRADYMSADYIKVGLSYFNGQYSLGELLEDIGNKSYETGLAINS
ncbi:MAG: zinc dependent phospholipase C family protein [Oscillospiraceae bacterium]